MASVSYARHQFPPVIIQHAVWLYLRFSLSYRDVEDLLAERGLDVSYETIRRWVLKFGALFARELRKRRPHPTSQWHLDELVVAISGKRLFLWRAVDSEGEVLDLLVQRRRDKAAAVRFLRKALKKQGLRARGDRDGQAALLWRRQGADRAFGPPRAGLADEQPGRKLASAHSAA
jgi:transposase-like protein